MKACGNGFLAGLGIEFRSCRSLAHEIIPRTQYPLRSFVLDYCRVRRRGREQIGASRLAYVYSSERSLRNVSAARTVDTSVINAITTT